MNWIALNPMSMYHSSEIDLVSTLIPVMIIMAIVAGVIAVYLYFSIKEPVFSEDQEKRINELIEKKLKETA